MTNSAYKSEYSFARTVQLKNVFLNVQRKDVAQSTNDCLWETNAATMNHSR